MIAGPAIRHTPGARRAACTPVRGGVRPVLPAVTLTLLLLLVANMALGQSPTRETIERDIRFGFEDAGEVFTAPLRFDAEDWLYTALALGATAAAYGIDEDVRDEARAFHAGDWEAPLIVGQWYGSGAVSGAVGAGLYIAGLAGDDDHTRVTGRLVLESLAYSGAITQLLKMLTGRARPETGADKSEFGFFSLEDSRNSFPSGHTTVAFALSSTLSRRVGSVPFSILLYGLATLTAAHRITHDRHWLSDTVLGAVIGGVVGIAVVRLEEERVSGMSLSAPMQFGTGTAGEFGRHRPLLVWSVGL